MEHDQRKREQVDGAELTALVAAARAGDARAQHELAASYLPLVYNIVGRALGGHADVDDIVQEAMVRMLRGLPALRDPASFRSWLVAIAMNETRRQQRPAPVDSGLQDAYEVPDPGSDFTDVTILRLGLSGERKEVARATRWMDDDYRELLALWWLEAAGELTRTEIAQALDLSAEHTAVRVQRMKAQLEAARTVVRALAATPRCPELAALTGSWDGRPSALWRKRLARHTRACAACTGHGARLTPAEGLLAGLALVPPLMAGTLHVTDPGASAHTAHVQHTAHAEHLEHTDHVQHADHTQHVDHAQHVQHTDQTQLTQHGPHPDHANHTEAIPHTMHPQDPVDPMSTPHPADQAAPGSAYPHHPDHHAYDAGTGYGEPYRAHDADATLADGVTAISPASGSGASGSRAELRQGRRTTRRRRQAVAAGAGIVAIATLTAVMQFSTDDSDGSDKSTTAAMKTDEPTPSSSAPSSTPEAKKARSTSPSKSAKPKKKEKKKTAKPVAKPTRTATPKPNKPKPPTPPKTSRPTADPKPPAPSGPMAQQVLSLVNTERQKAGCRPLTNNSKLATAAQRHSADMKARNYFSHTSPDGTDPGKRITAAGYQWSTYGENIARGQQSASSVMSSWMNSEGHRANILNCSFKEMGMGIEQGSGGPWWTQAFGAR
ncbi:sigma-70 family RNA polymerase sigma factor [Streptomyces lasiicapitis]|uniref:sigma-70 family RNA polymerase sigma factor n=1 Tax=Streptomyces lasiicapitis TaxID=1923961 RepID=UPI00365F09A2